MNSPRSRPEIFSLLAVTMIAAVLVHQPATVYCADGGNNSSQQQQQKQQGTMMFTAPSGYYLSTYDNLDVGQLLRNPKVVSGFLRCFVNDGPCTPDGKLVKGKTTQQVVRQCPMVPFFFFRSVENRRGIALALRPLHYSIT